MGMHELLVILAIALLLFGRNRLPELAQSLGESVHIFRRALDGDDRVAPKG